MVGAIIVAIILLSYLRNKSDAIHSDQPASSRFGLLQFMPYLVYWLAIFFGWVVVVATADVPYPLALLFVVLITCPSITSFITAQLGLVKISYFLGRLSIVVFRRNPHAGGLYRGFLAVRRIKHETKKREGLLWLKNRFLSHNSKIYSGDIIVYTIIDCQLTQPNNFAHLAQQLRRLADIGKESIPKEISRYAFRCAIVPSIAKADWHELSSIAFQWDTPAKNRFSKFVKEFSGAHIFKKEAYSKIESFYYRLFCFYVPVLFTLPKRYSDYLEKKQPEQTLSFGVGDLMQQESLSAEQVAQFSNALMDDKVKEKWVKRASELGSWQPELSWEKIKQSITTSLISKSNSGDVVEYKNDEYYETIDRHCKSLIYIAHSIDSRLKSKNIGTGVQNFLDWKKICNTLEELESNPQAHLSAFQSIENTIWNWIADLWNTKKEYCLVHYICKYCIPLVEQTGNTEFFNIITGITAGRYR